jgi:hypothetical protein
LPQKISVSPSELLAQPFLGFLRLKPGKMQGASLVAPKKNWCWLLVRAFIQSLNQLKMCLGSWLSFQFPFKDPDPFPKHSPLGNV